MKCESAQEIIALAAWGEIPDQQRQELDEHLATCEACRAESEAIAAVIRAVSLAPAEEPSANLLARTRLRLEEALDALPRESWLVRLLQRFSLGMARLRSAPLAASALIVLGLVAGAYGGFRLGAREHDKTQTNLILRATGQNGPAQIADVSDIKQVPNSNDVVVSYNRLVPDSIQGAPSAPQIRRLLVIGARKSPNPGVRTDSVSLLADQCRTGRACASSGPIRNTLMVSMLYDRSPEVRLKALDGLQPFVANDMQVRDAVLEALMNDTDPEVRAEAIGLLAPVEADSSVREVLHTVATQDNNPHIRDVSEQMLAATPQIQ